VPGAFKTYIDKVFGIGYATGSMTIGDGRTRSDLSKKYGTGGILTEKKYMVSTTWNAPKSVFEDNDEFMDGLNLDESTATLHKTFQFCGMKKLPSFAIYDIFKDAHIKEDIETFKKHINDNF
jgi:modulator of drug activity B